MYGRLSLTLAILAGILCGCPRTTPQNDAGASKPEDGGAPAASVSAPSSASLATGPAFDASMPNLTGPDDERFRRLSIGQRLLVEQANRPPDTLTAETVFNAITKKLDVPVNDQGQLAAFPVAAGYCAKGQTAAAIDITVCEYRDAAALARGKAAAIKAFNVRREFVTVKLTWVSITRYTEAADSAAQAKKIADLVKTL